MREGIKEAIEWVEELDYNPYPEDIFLPIPQEQYNKIHELLKREMGMPIDRLMGHIGRKLRKNIFYDINKKDIISLLQQGEAYRQMWEELKKKHTEAKIRNTCPEGLIDRYLFMREIEVIEQKYFPKEVKQDKNNPKG